MLNSNAVIVVLGAVILLAGLFYTWRIISILKNFNLARPWVVLFTLISFILFGYIFSALRFLDLNLIPGVTLEGLVTAIFFFGAVFVLILAVLNRNLFANIFGVGLSDTKAILLFSEHLKVPAREIIHIRPNWRGNCTSLEVSCTSGENLAILLRYLAGSVIKSRQIMP